VALTPFPARVAARPVVFLCGSAAEAAYTSSKTFEHKLLERAAEARLRRRRGDPLVVHDAELDDRSLDGLSPAERHILLAEQADAVVGDDPYWKNRPGATGRAESSPFAESGGIHKKSLSRPELRRRVRSFRHPEPRSS
jgi:hypothetical protein